MATSTYTYPVTLEEFAVPLASYLQTHPTLDGLVVSALIFHPGSSSMQSTSTSGRRLLIIQRAATDGFPLKWECPGGGAESADATILDSLCREVGEETGLKVTRVLKKSDVLDEWISRQGGRWRKITFVVDAETKLLADDSEKKKGNDDAPPPEVTLNPEEHQDFYWASLEEVQECRFDDGREIDFAYDAQRGTILGLFD